MTRARVSSVSTCVVDGCELECCCKGMCQTHYNRMWRTGSTFTPIRKRPISDRLEWRSKKVLSGCIEWQGAKTNGGYGVMSVDAKPQRVHRLAWELGNGPIPDGMSVCHSCDNPPCLNVDHLFLGSQEDNAQDASAKGRIVHGEEHSNSKLNSAKVREIRRLASLGNSHSKIASLFNVSQPHVSRIVRGEQWRKV